MSWLSHVGMKNRLAQIVSDARRIAVLDEAIEPAVLLPALQRRLHPEATAWINSAVYAADAHAEPGEPAGRPRDLLDAVLQFGACLTGLRHLTRERAEHLRPNVDEVTCCDVVRLLAVRRIALLAVEPPFHPHRPPEQIGISKTYVGRADASRSPVDSKTGRAPAAEQVFQLEMTAAHNLPRRALRRRRQVAQHEVERARRLLVQRNVEHGPAIVLHAKGGRSDRLKESGCPTSWKSPVSCNR